MKAVRLVTVSCVVLLAKCFVSLGSNDCERHCLAIVRPVCGSNGTLYVNRCRFLIDKCKLEKDSQILRLEPLNKCLKDRPKSFPETAAVLNDVLRDTSDNTSSVSSIDEKIGPVVSRATKDADCDINCPETSDGPICADNAVLYANACELEKANCLRRKAGKNTVQPIQGMRFCTDPRLAKALAKAEREQPPPPRKPKDCDRDDCPKTYEPVCGSDGNIYPNECIFEVAKCKFLEDGYELRKRASVADCKAALEDLPELPAWQVEYMSS